jgi:hypothetical protein
MQQVSPAARAWQVSRLAIRQENSDIVFPPISAKDAEMDGARSILTSFMKML